MRVRFAPSPTGYLHIGGARTALFNFLTARKESGVFILRIEDTDLQRSSVEMAQGILEALSWLGLEWDQGPIYQSQRLELYRDTCRKLLEAGSAYRCFCSPEDLERRKAKAIASEGGWRYDRTCRDLDSGEASRRLDRGDPQVLRFKVPDGWTIRFKDQVYGKLEVESGNVEDFVLLRSDGMPTYHLAVVADDADLDITHVIRGVDHLLNTSKHMLLYQALGLRPPGYAHLPLILGPDKKRLSKRHGATSVLEFREQGFLPSAMRNYLALLGWSPGQNQEIFSDHELIEQFSLSRVNKADAVFDHQKLLWMNGKHVSTTPVEELAPLVRQELEKEGLWDQAWEGRERPYFLRGVQLLLSRMRIIPDFVQLGRAYFSDDFGYDPAALEKFLPAAQRPHLLQALRDLRRRFGSLDPFDLRTTESTLRGLCDENGWKAGELIGVVRVALTGQGVSPGIFEVIHHFGKERTVGRMDRLVGSVR